MTTQSLMSKIEYLIKSNTLLVLRHANSVYQHKLVHELTNERIAIDLSDPAIRDRAMWQPQEFLRKLDKPALLLNLQYAPQLVPYITADTNAGAYLATATQMCYLSDVLRGAENVVVLDLPMKEEMCKPFQPCSNYLRGLSGVKSSNVLHSIFTGCIFGSDCNIENRSHLFSEYVKGFLQRDIQDMTTVSDAMKFYRFLCAVAAETGNMVNYAMLAKAADISSPTAKTWLNFLDGAGIVRLLWPINHPVLKRIAKAPKIYFADTGLAAYLLRINSEEELADSSFFTALFENYVINSIKESFLGNGLDVQLSYLRDSNVKEIDLILQYEGTIYPVEITKDQPNVNKLLKKFNVLAPLREDKNIFVGNGCVVTLGSDVQQWEENLWQVGAGRL